MEKKNPLNKTTNDKNGSFQIIGAGLGRTGTNSLKDALTYLGYRCFHGGKVFENGFDEKMADFFIDAVTKQENHCSDDIDFSIILNDYDAGCDINIAKFYKELFKINPQAKVILTIRDLDEWYISFRNTLIKADKERALKISKESNKEDKKKNLMFDLLYYQTIFENKENDKDFMISKHREHIEEVKNTIPQNQLLVFNVQDGWEPLCKFLDVDIPDVDFPMKNTTKMFWERWEPNTK